MGDWWRSLATLLGLTFRAARGRVVAYYVITFVNELALLTSLWGVKKLLDAALSADAGEAVMAAAVIAGLGYVGTVVNRNQFHRAVRINEETMRLLDEELMALTAGVPGIAHHELPEHADRIALVVEERRTLAYTGHILAQSLRGGVQLAGSVLLLALMHPSLLLLPAFGVFSMVGQARAQRLIDRARAATAEAARHRQELVALATSSAAGKEIRLFGLQDELLRRHHEASRQVAGQRNGAGVRAAALRAAGRLAFAVGYVGAIGIVLWEALHGRATPGDVILAVILAASINSRLATAADELAFLSRAVGVGHHLVWLIDHATQAQAVRDQSASIPAALESGIHLDDVSFRYAGAADPALRNVTLTLPAGSVVALVGENGSGKTTLVKLLTRMYEPTSGRITVDGIDLQNLSAEAWRQATSAAFQDFWRFEFLLRETVGVGDVDHIDDRTSIEAALVRAGADDVAQALPNGIDTQLGRAWDGVELSGGQWQKLALSRTVMRATPLLVVFDEPTASLDPMSEQMLFERFAAATRQHAPRGSITLLVSHRFSTVRMADLIVVLDHGQVLEVGSHDELVARGGLYAELYSLQARALTGQG